MVLPLCVSETLKHIKNGGEKEQFCCSTSRTAAQNGLNYSRTQNIHLYVMGS